MICKESNNFLSSNNIWMRKQLAKSKHRYHKTQAKVDNQHPKLTNLHTKISCGGQNNLGKNI